MLILTAILNGIFIGSIYSLIAVGLTIIFGVMKIINFAHGSLLMISMFGAFWFTVITGINPYFSIIILGPALFLLGYAIQKVIIKSVIIAESDVREPIGVLLLTSGLWIFLDNIFMVFFGPDYRTIPLTQGSQNFMIGDSLLINIPRFSAFVVSCVVTSLLNFFLKISETGRMIRAVGQDRKMAGLLGIDIHRIYNIAFGIAAVTVAFAGILLTPFYYIHPNVGSLFGVKSFIIVVLGGLGSIPGAFLGGIIVGLIESVGTQFVSSTATEAVIYLIFLSVLFYRPAGLFGFKQEW